MNQAMILAPFQWLSYEGHLGVNGSAKSRLKSETMVMNRDECLHAWWSGVQRFLEGDRRYRNFAEDAAQVFILGLLYDERSGQSIPTWPGSLSEVYRKAARKAARGEVYTVALEAFDERVQKNNQASPEGRLCMVASKRIKNIACVFSKPMCDKLICHSREEVRTKKYLAEAVGMPYRTFKYKVEKVKSMEGSNRRTD